MRDEKVAAFLTEFEKIFEADGLSTRAGVGRGNRKSIVRVPDTRQPHSSSSLWLLGIGIKTGVASSNGSELRVVCHRKKRKRFAPRFAQGACNVNAIIQGHPKIRLNRAAPARAVESQFRLRLIEIVLAFTSDKICFSFPSKAWSWPRQPLTSLCRWQ